MTTINESITKTLGTGSGIDTKALVTSLVAAQFTPTNDRLTKQSDTLTAQISSVSKLQSSIKGFSDALNALIAGGSLTTQPTSSNSQIATLAVKKGGTAKGLSAQITVEKLASAQAATSTAAIATDQTYRGGTLTVKIGSYETVNGVTTLNAAQTIPITIGDGVKIDQIALSIKNATGLQTQLVKDGNGVRLTIKGTTGADAAFEIEGADTDTSAPGTNPGDPASLSTLSVGPSTTGMTVGTKARDAEVTVDGATFKRPTNIITDLLPGVDLTLASAQPGTTVTLGATPPIAGLSAAVDDFVTTFNELKNIVKTEIDPKTGSLANDSAAKALDRALGQLTLTKIVSTTDGSPQTLSDLGVSTNRDGTLALDKKKLANLLISNPGGVEAMFAVDAAGNGGLSQALKKISDAAADKTYGLGAATTRYTNQQADLTKQKTKATDDAAAMTDRLTRQFAGMDARVAAYKATQAFMEQQVKVWTQSNN
ncbi:flagellar hook-associated protein 2 [Sphingomonas metalli]|uniref:Flagellar hook-associated protein 2 n=1 Tax=Sphingomonas metalli TaxID=1779358 RepID=A0A916SYN3_9SPHN|nr:flagellar filament capping protein FliD [Sphingomonas metalli]GGB23428.1 flagellar hook-associated protein 2 [Sphingomonas metalli]